MGIGIPPKPTTPTTLGTTASIAIIAGLQALGILLAPDVQRGAFDTSFINEALETVPYSFVAGTNRVTPNLTWYGDFATKEVKNDVAAAEMLLQAGLFGYSGYLAGGGHHGIGTPDPPSAYIGLAEGTAAGLIIAGMGKFRTFSFRYYAGFAYTISHGVIDAITEVFVDERRVGIGTVLSGTILLDDPQAWGGDHEQGGVYAFCDIVKGELWPTQQPNTYLKSQLSGTVPAFSGKALFVMRGPAGYLESGYFSAGVQESPPLRPVTLTVLRQPNLLGVPAYKSIRTHDANPIEVIYDWMTGRTRGFGYGGRVPLDKFDLANFQAAAAVVHTEGLGYSGELKDNVSVLQNLEDLCSFVGCFIYEHPVTGLVTLKLIRRDYVVASLPVFDESNIESVEGYTPGTYRDVPNEIRLTYVDRDFNYKPRPIIAQNDASMRLIQETLSRTISFPGIGCKETAGIIAARELSSSFPRPPLKLIVNSDGESVQLGEAIVWNYDKYQVAQMVLRVVGVKRSDTDTNKFELTCAQDVFGRGDVITAYPGATLWVQPTFQFHVGEYILPMLQIAGTGEVSDRAGAGNFVIPQIQIAGAGTVDAAGAGSFNIPQIQISGAGTVEVGGGGSFNIP
jgi:hypothetical protein